MSLGAIADDVTGATDLASVLCRLGLTVIQTIGIPRDPLPAADALVMSLKARTAAPWEVSTMSAAAGRRLLDAGVTQLYFKYCSTFDSTDSGNIGPVIDTLLEQLAAPVTVACPAYPAYGRTVYQGHLFVNDRLLSESSMRHHPLTPMTDSNLVQVLGRQCLGRVGLVSLVDVEAGVGATRDRLEALAAAGYRVAIVDALFDRHLDTVGSACAGLRLATGGAALGGALARARLGAMTREGAVRRISSVTAPVAVLSGSCSATTLKQVERLATVIPARALDPVALSENAEALPCLIEWATNLARRGRSLLLFSTAAGSDVQQAQARLGRQQAAAAVECGFQELGTALAAAGVRTFAVAGGETSAAVLQGLAIRMLGFADEVAPGVPWVYSLDPEGFTLALKSGNFGGPNFFLKVLEAAS